MTQQETIINKAAKFMVENSTYRDVEQMKHVIAKHIEYRSCVIIVDHYEVLGIIRWNQMPDGKTAYVCDMIIADKAQHSGVVHELIGLAIKCAPWAEKVIFERGYDDGLIKKEFRTYNIEKLFRRISHAYGHQEVR